MKLPRDQLTPAEAEALEKLIDRVGLSTLAAAIGCICEDKRFHLIASWQDPTSARHWADMSLEFSIVERKARNKFGR